MRNILLCFFACFIATQAISAQGSNCPQRYKRRVFNSIQIFRDVVYSKDAPKLLTASLGIETWLSTDLKMDIFMPPPTDVVDNRPVVILAHGGGFVNIAFMGGTVLVGTMHNEDVQALADTLAHWGFVTASIEYRTGFDVLSQTSITRAVWRGSQDVSAAVRFFRKNANWFGIDPQRVFIGGSSAGAFACLHSTFVDGSERVPESLEQTPILMEDLGEMHSRPVVELTSFNPFAGTNVLGNDVDSIAQGIASYWGAIASPSMIAGNNRAPVIMFHGSSDLVVDAQCAQPFSSLILVAPVTCGSIVLDSAMTAQNLLHETYIESGEGHEYWGVLNGDWLPSGPNAYWADMIDKTAQFFYKIMRPATPTIIGSLGVAPSSTHTYSIQNPAPNTTYCWEVVNGTIINSGNPNGSTIQVLWSANQGIGTVKASTIDAAQVVSLQRNYNVNISNLVAVDNLQANQQALSISPNPNAGSFDLRFTPSTSDDCQVRIFDLNGREIYAQTIVSPAANAETIQHINTNLTSGVYSLILQQGSSRRIQKIIIY
jgi:acetyl esterase/lipase